jgi:hypothetical protein
MVKTAVIPQVRVEPELRAELEAVLERLQAKLDAKRKRLGR